MARPFFTWNTTKKVIVAFATIFDDIEVWDDFDRPYKVPLVFSQKEKFVEAFTAGADMNDNDYDITWPRMGFELQGISFASERHTNPLNTIIDTLADGQEVMTYNRVPYDFSFELFIGARKIEDTLKILEQIIPFFTPELTVTIRDRPDFNLETNVPVVLNSVSLSIENEGSFNTRRQIMWTLNFTAKAYFYPDRKKSTQIKQTILGFGDLEYEKIFTKYTSTVTPESASRTDPHTIVDTKEQVFT